MSGTLSWMSDRRIAYCCIRDISKSESCVGVLCVGYVPSHKNSILRCFNIGEIDVNFQELITARSDTQGINDKRSKLLASIRG